MINVIDYSKYRYNAKEESGKGYFCVCFDINNLSQKTFYKFDLVDKQIGIEMLKKHQYGYEYNCDTKTKLYFDIDLNEYETIKKYAFMSEKYLLEFIDQLRRDINLFLCKELLLSDFFVFIKKEPDFECKTKIESIHIIIPSIVISKQHSHDLVEELNMKFSYKLDANVYKSKGQAFCCLGSCKYGKTKKWIELDDHPFKKYNDFEETLIFTTENVNTKFKSTPITDDKGVVVLTEFKDLILDDLDDVLFHRSSNWKYITYAFCVFFSADINKWLKYSAERSDKYSYEQNLEFIKKFDKTKIKYNKKKLAKKLTYYSSKYEYDVNESSNTELYDFYAKKNNLQIAYGNIKGHGQENSIKNEVSNTTGFLSRLLGLSTKFINDETKYPLVLKEYNEKNKIGEYVHGHITQDKQPIPSMYVVLEKYKFANYHIDELLEKTIIPSNIAYEKFNTLEESTYIIDDLLNSDDSFTLFVEAPCGSGKSRTTTMRIITEYDYHSIIAITPNNSINIETTEKLNINQSKYVFKSHIEDKHNDYPFRLTSLESLHHFSTMNAELVILDEITSIISQFESNTTGLKSAEEKYTKFMFFKQVVQNAKHVIVLDAFIKEDHIELINNIRKNVKTNNDEVIVPRYIQSSKSIFEEYKHNIYANICKIKEKLFNSLDNNERIVINSDSKKECDKWFGIITSQYDANVMMLTKDGVMIYNGDKKIVDYTKNNMDINNLSQKELDEKIISIKKRLDYHLTYYDVRVFIYSPTITCGVSIELRDHFNNFYGFYSCKSVNTTSLLQGIWRVRSNIAREFNMYFKECGYLKEEYDVLNYNKTFKKMINKEEIICNFLKTNNINKDVFLHNIEHNCPEYFKMRIMNQLRNTFDLKFMVSNIINTFKTYNMDFEIIYDRVIVVDIVKPIKSTEVDIFTSFEDYLHTPPITDEVQLCKMYYQYEFIDKENMNMLDIKRYIKFKSLVNYSTLYLHKINEQDELYELIKKKNKIKLLLKDQTHITDVIYITTGIITYDEYKKSLYFNGTATISTYDNYYIYKNIVINYDKIRRPYKLLLEIYTKSLEEITTQHEQTHHKIHKNEFGTIEYSYNYNNFDKTHENEILYRTLKQIMNLLYNYDISNPNQIKYDIVLSKEILDRFVKHKNIIDNMWKCYNILTNKNINPEFLTDEVKPKKNDCQFLTPLLYILQKINFYKHINNNKLNIENRNKFNLIQAPINNNHIQRIEYDGKLYYFKIYKTNYKTAYEKRSNVLYYAELIYINKIITKKRMDVFNEIKGKTSRVLVDLEYSFFIMNTKDNTKLGQGYKTITEMKDDLKSKYTNKYLNRIYDTKKYTTDDNIKYAFNKVLYELKKEYNSKNYFLKGKAFKLKDKIQTDKDIYNIDEIYTNGESIHYNNCEFESHIIKHKTFKYIEVNIQVCNKYKNGLPIVLAYARGHKFITENYRVAVLDPMNWSIVIDLYEDLSFIQKETEPSSIPIQKNQKKITEWASYNVSQKNNIAIDNDAYSYYHIIIV